MYVFLDFDGFRSCRSLMEDELRACGELNEWLRKLCYTYEIDLDGRADVARKLYKRTSELEEAMRRRQIELSRIVEELAGTYTDCERIITEAREAAGHMQGMFDS